MSQANKHENIHIINLALDTPKAVVQEKRNSDWISFGENNDYYERLIELFKRSNLHRRITMGITDRIVGEGLQVAYPERSAVDWSSLNNLFPRSEQIKIAKDVALFSRYALKLTTNNAGTKIVKVEHFPVNTLRPEKQNEDGKIENYYYSKDWLNYRKAGNEPEPYECFDFESSRQKGEFVAVFYPYEAGNMYLNPVDYNGALNWIQADVDIQDYHLSNIQNGFSGATIFQFYNGQPNERSRRINENLLKEKYSGAKGDKLMFIYHQSPEQKIDVENINLPDADKQYEVLSEEIKQGVMIAHGVTSPMLLGIKQNTGLGNNADEINTANQLFEQTVIRPKQLFYLSGIEEVLRWNGSSLDLSIRPLRILNDTSETTKTEITTLAEEKEDDGFKVLTDEDQDYLLDYLEDKGEDENELLGKGFKVVQEEDLQGDDELKIKGQQLKNIELQSAWGLTPNNLSKYDVKAKDGSGVWLVRYQYALAATSAPPAIIPTSRKFCRQMIDSAKNGNRVYKREVLEDLNNPEFGSYNIFWYKGSYNCRHVWKRKLYFKPNDGVVTPVGNVPYVASRLSDKRATTKNTPVKR